jgi:hypothetical protein
MIRELYTLHILPYKHKREQQPKQVLIHKKGKNFRFMFRLLN